MNDEIQLDMLSDNNTQNELVNDISNESEKINYCRTIKNHPTTDKKIGDINTLSKEEKEKYVQEFIKQIFRKLQLEKTFVIDRFEENFAVCEDQETEEMVNIEKNKLPEEVQEGDVIHFKNNHYEIDKEKRIEIEERINNKLKNLFND